MATPDIKMVIKDPRFLALPAAEKVKVMNKIDPNFNKLPDIEKTKVSEKLSNPETVIIDKDKANPESSWRKTVSEYARHMLEMAGGAAGAIIGTGAGVASTGGIASPVLGVAGGGLGYAMGGEAADLIDQWMGLQKQKPLDQELKQAGGRVIEGAAFEAGGQGAIAAAMPVFRGVKNIAKKILPPLTPKATSERVGEILLAHTDEGPLIARNIAEADKLEKEIPGLKFTRAQKTNDPGTIKLERGQMLEPGSFAKEELEQKAQNSVAIKTFLAEKQGGGTIDDALSSARGQKSDVEGRVLGAEQWLKSEVQTLDTGADIQAGGRDIKDVITSAKGSTKARAGQKFKDLPDMEFEAKNLHEELGRARQPFDRYEDVSDDVIPKVLERATKLIEDDGYKITLKEAQSLSSNLGKQIRGGRNIKEPAYISRLERAKRAVDNLIETGEPSLINPEKAAQAQVYDGMKAEVLGSETRGSNYTDEGRIFYSASSPPWMSNMQKAVKTDGGKQFSRKEITTLLDKIKSGKPLTEIQAGRAKYIEDAVQDFKNSDQTAMGFGEADDLISDGFEPMGGRSMSAGELVQGDEFVGKVGSKQGTFKVEATNDGGAILVDDVGIDYELGIADKITMDGMKTGKDIGELSSTAQAEAEKTALKSTQKKAAAQLKDARTTWRKEYIEKFKQGPVADILKKGKDGADKIQSAQIASQFFKPGRAGSDAADAFIKAVGDDPKARQAILDYATQDLIQSATKPISGELTDTGLAKWVHKHGKALDKFGIRDNFKSVETAAKNVADARVMKKTWQKSATAKLLGVDPEKAIAKAVGTDNQRQALMELVSGVKGDKAATAGLQNSLIDHMVEVAKVETTDAFGSRVVNPKRMAKQMRKYKPAMEILFKSNPEKLEALETVQKALATVQRNVASPIGGGSDTAEKILTAMSKKAFMGVAKINAVVKAAMSPIKDLSDKEVNALLNRALLDPDFSQTLVMMSKGAKKTVISDRIKGHMVALGINSQYGEK